MNRIEKLYERCIRSAVTAHLLVRGMKAETVEKVLEIYKQ